MWLKNSDSNISIEEFRWTLAVINPVAMAQFFEAICTSIFKCFLAAGFINQRLIRLVSIC